MISITTSAIEQIKLSASQGDMEALPLRIARCRDFVGQFAGVRFNIQNWNFQNPPLIHATAPSFLA